MVIILFGLDVIVDAWQLHIQDRQVTTYTKVVSSNSDPVEKLVANLVLLWCVNLVEHISSLSKSLLNSAVWGGSKAFRVFQCSISCSTHHFEHCTIIPSMDMSYSRINCDSGLNWQ